jgi:hypothetical protein
MSHHSPVHKTKFKKNLAIFLGIMSLIALFWIMTMVKIAANKDQNPALQPQSETLKSGEVKIE